MDNSLYNRFTEETVRESLGDTPVALIHGTRKCGKTTLAQVVGEQLGVSTVIREQQSETAIKQYG